MGKPLKRFILGCVFKAMVLAFGIYYSLLRPNWYARNGSCGFSWIATGIAKLRWDLQAEIQLHIKLDKLHHKEPWFVDGRMELNLLAWNHYIWMILSVLLFLLSVFSDF